MKYKCKSYESCRSRGMPNCTEKCNTYLKSINKDKSDICEWEEGKFNPCSGFNGVVLQTPPANGEGLYRYFCEICGMDIMKPVGVPEVIIKKSGGTWAIGYNKINYLVVNIYKFGLIGRMVAKDQDGLDELIEKNIIKPILGLEITDEVAKLRPMVKFRKFGENCLDVLIGVINNKSIHSSSSYILPELSITKDIILATVSDLED